APADAGVRAHGRDGGIDQVLAAYQEARALRPPQRFTAGECDQVETFANVLRQPADRRSVRGGVIERGYAALLAHADPLVALDLAVGLHFVVEEHHRGAVI